MKTLAILFSSLLLATNPATVALIDIQLKKPVTHTEDFTFEHYAQKQFPVYTADLKQVAASLQKVAKLLDSKTDFTFDSVKTGHSFLVLNTRMEENFPILTVRLITVIPETHTSFSIDLVRPEDDKRKIQMRLLNLSDYLEKN